MPTRIAASARAFGKTSGLLLGGIITLLLVSMALVSLAWTPYPPTAIDIAHKLALPSPAHPFGTDPFGRDVLSMIMVGAGNSIAVSLVAVAVGLGFGVPLGGLAAARGGWMDEITMLFTDLAFAFPALLTAVMNTAIAGPGAVNAILAIGIFDIPAFARLTRSAALGLWPRDFVLAARPGENGGIAPSVERLRPNLAA